MASSAATDELTAEGKRAGDEANAPEEDGAQRKGDATESTEAPSHDTNPGRPAQPVQAATDGPSLDKGKSVAATDEGASPMPERAPTPVLPKPFDFNRFLEQMKHRSAVPVNEYVRSFFRGFTKRPYKPADQVKLIFDFLEFISARMAEAEVWAHLSDPEFDQATEAMEKLIMNRLYTYTFSPAIQQEGHWTVQTNDLERDQVLSQRIRLLAWVDETHLDVARGPHSARFNDFAVQELRKINQYRAPRDKIICMLNCCKVIFGLIRHLDQAESADAFVPLLILVILRANPPNLVSNLEYIVRFKNPRRPTSEADYYLSSLSGAIAFIESMDYSTLSNVTQAEYDAHVHEAAAVMEAEAAAQPSAPSLPLHAQMAAVTLADDALAFLQRTSEAARDGLSSGLTKPMGALGKLLYERLDEVLAPVEPTPQTPATRARPAPKAPVRPARTLLEEDDGEGSSPAAPVSPLQTPARGNKPPEWRSGFVPHTREASPRDSPSRHVAAHPVEDTSGDMSVDWDAGTHTLSTIFPQADASVLRMVLQESDGNVERAIDRLLEMA